MEKLILELKEKLNEVEHEKVLSAEEDFYADMFAAPEWLKEEKNKGIIYALLVAKSIKKWEDKYVPKSI